MEWQHWPSLPLTQRQHLPSQSGIYVVVDAEDQVWYVGLSRNINARWNGRGHHRYKQLSRTHNKRLYRIHWQLCPPAQLVTQEQYYINLFKPHLNYSRVKVYARKARQPHQELSRLFKVLNQKSRLFPDLRSVVLGYYLELDEDDTGALEEYPTILTVVNVNDHDKTIINSYHKSYSKRATTLKDCWGVHESTCGDSSPDARVIQTPVFMSGDIAYEFVCYYSLIDQLAQQRASLYTVELAKQTVWALRDINVLLALLAADKPRTGHEIYLHHRAADIRSILELLEMPKP